MKYVLLFSLTRQKSLLESIAHNLVQEAELYFEINEGEKKLTVLGPDILGL